jgi:hypothetical protein
MNEQIEIAIKVTLVEANVILESLGNNKLNDIFQLYMKVRGQIEAQYQEALAPKEHKKD